MELIPYEILVNEVLRYCDVQSVHQFSLANQKYVKILREQIIWRKRFATKLQISLEEVSNNINFNDYKLLPKIISKIKEIKSNYCLYTFMRGQLKYTMHMAPTTANSNYCTSCLIRPIVQKNPAIAYVLIDNEQHQGMPQFVGNRVNNIIHDLREPANTNKVCGKYWKYEDKHYYIIKE